MKHVFTRARKVATASVAATAAACGFLVAAAVPASAVGVSQPTLVSAVPSSFTPNVNDGIVYSIAKVGNWIVLGGSFTTVTAHGATTAVARTDVLAYNSTTGALNTGFAPTLDGQVNSVIAGPTANTVYVGGAFTTVNGVKSKSLALLNINTGAAVAGFKTPALDGVVQSMRVSGSRLYIAGSFTTVAGVLHQGIATVNATTGALDPFMNVQLTGHHNYPNGVSGAVGGRAMDISPDGTKAVVIGDFKDANGALHDQVVMLNLTGASATIANWNTSGYTAACASGAFDSYVEDVAFSPDGSYFAIAATGGGGLGATNTDGTRALCDSGTRWSSTATGTNVQPTWIDYTGNDTFWSVATTGTAVYFGGHERWVNNSDGQDYAAQGAVIRPGIVALDPVNGLPFSWNPGRDPRGAGAYALLATAQGLYVGSDTDYIGDYQYMHGKNAFFPLAGGETVPSVATATLPGNLFQAGPTSSGTASSLSTHAVTATTYGPAATVSTGIDWSTTRGAFMAGNEIFYGDTDGHFYEASYNGVTVGTPVAIDPYDDAIWDPIQTGSNGTETYTGVKSGYYGEMASVTGAFYSNGKLFYTKSGSSTLFWRYFTPESGVIGSAEFSVAGTSFGANVAGMVLSGSTLYYANKSDGTLHTLSFSSVIGSVNPVIGTADKTVSGPAIDGNDWRAHGLFAYASAVTGTTTKTVKFVGDADYNGLSSSPSVTAPAGIAAGDTELLFVSVNTAGVTAAAPSGALTGWTQISKTTNATLETTVFRRTATAADSGQAVSVALSTASQADLQLADYSGVSTATAPLATATDAATGTHVAPAIAVTAAGSWVLNYWADRSSTTSAWTLPTTVTSRGVGVGTVATSASGVLADSGAPAASGTHAAQTAVANATSGRGNMVSIVLTPAS